VDVPATLVRARELRPFAAAVQAGAASVMTGAVVVPSIDPSEPATFSRVLLQDVLRGELGFAGTIVSDALDMAGASADTGIPEAAVRAIVAGCDLLCLGSHTAPELVAEIADRVEGAVESGRLPLARLTDAAAAVDRLADRWAARVPAPTAYAALPDEVVAGAFELSDGARTWLRGAAPVALVQVETPTNLAVGPVPWGVAALGLAVDERDVAAGARVAVVGRAVGPDHPARAVVARLEASGHDVVLVECGWPRGPVDVATWGGSPAVARALVGLLSAQLDADLPST
jgi:beta-N-acetylhexosaminidase